MKNVRQIIVGQSFIESNVSRLLGIIFTSTLLVTVGCKTTRNNSAVREAAKRDDDKQLFDLFYMQGYPSNFCWKQCTNDPYVAGLRLS